MSAIGNSEGDRCNRPNDEGFACDGSMEFLPVEGCFCHISLVCSACTDNPLTCTVCGQIAEGDA